VPERAAPNRSDAQLSDVLAQNAELRLKLQELEDTLSSIHHGDVDALVVNGGIYTLESAHESTSRMRRDVLDQMEDAVFAFDLDDHVVYMNNAAERRYGVTPADVLGRHRSQIFIESPAAPRVPDDLPPAPSTEQRAGVESTHLLLDGTTLRVESIVSRLLDADGNTIGSLAVIRDVSQRYREQSRRDALVRLSDRLRDLDDPDEMGFVAARILGETLAVSRVGCGTIDAASETLRVERDWTAPGVESLAGVLNLREFGSFVDSLKRNEFVAIEDVRTDRRTATTAAALESRSARSFVNVPVVERGQLVAVLYVNDASVRRWSMDELHFVRDVAERLRAITERVHAVRALRDSEARLRQANESLEIAVAHRTRELMATEEALRQSQKMEAIGQLTGGIAHDFNNLLAVVSNSLQILQRRLGDGHPEMAERYIGMARDSIRRAAALTHRLLAFSRRQTLDPKPTDVNRLIAGMEELIRRTAGPEVVVEVVGAGGLWPTQVDGPQLENALLNLCINARDAMAPQGGRLTIETANKWLDDHAAAERELSPGQYIAVCVSDTGAGMTPDVISRAFDPFFTTKPTGSGTGLGLSMVYGFVRQSGGQVRAYSQVGVGTTMCLYLPRFVGELGDAAKPDSVEAEGSADGETIMVIEDEEMIRTLVAEELQGRGYRVLSAPDGPAGLSVLRSDARIDLLISDVGLPGGLNGRQVADAARVTRPALKVLFVTGYAENAAVGNGLLEPGMEVMTKPFDLSALSARIRTMLER